MATPRRKVLRRLVETGLLFLTTAWIVFEAVKRLISGQQHIDVTWWAVAVIGGSILVDFGRARALNRVALETSSEALEADALHFSSDMWSSFVVLLGLVAVWFGFPLADPIAALIVSFFVGLAGWRLGKRTLATLLDTAPAGATAELRSLVEHTGGVLHLSSLRLRPAGPTLFTSVVVEVPRTMPVDDIVKLKDTLTDKIIEKFPSADVTVTVNPVTLDDETVFQRVMLIASRRNLAIHHLTVQEIKGRLAVSFDLEVDGLMPLVEAHEHATQLEDAIRSELGPGVEVESHIEPQPERLLSGDDAPAKTADAIIALLSRWQKNSPVSAAFTISESVRMIRDCSFIIIAVSNLRKQSMTCIRSWTRLKMACRPSFRQSAGSLPTQSPSAARGMDV